MDVSNYGLDKTAFSVASLQNADDEAWQTRTPEERLRALELIRQARYGYAGTSARLQRVLTVAQRERR
jgi:hypothetical protein